MTPYVDARGESVPCPITSDFLTLIVRPNSACVKRSLNPWECFFSMSHQGGVVGDGDVPDLGLGSESGHVEQPAVDRVCR